MGSNRGFAVRIRPRPSQPRSTAVMWRAGQWAARPSRCQFLPPSSCVYHGCGVRGGHVRSTEGSGSRCPLERERRGHFSLCQTKSDALRARGGESSSSDRAERPCLLKSGHALVRGGLTVLSFLVMQSLVCWGPAIRVGLEPSAASTCVSEQGESTCSGGHPVLLAKARGAAVASGSRTSFCQPPRCGLYTSQPALNRGVPRLSD